MKLKYYYRLGWFWLFVEAVVGVVLVYFSGGLAGILGIISMLMVVNMSIILYLLYRWFFRIVIRID